MEIKHSTEYLRAGRTQSIKGAQIKNKGGKYNGSLQPMMNPGPVPGGCLMPETIFELLDFQF